MNYRELTKRLRRLGCAFVRHTPFGFRDQ